MPAEIQFIRSVQALFQTPLGISFLVFCARWMIFLFAPLAAATSFLPRRASLRHAAYEAAWAGLLAITVATILGVLIGRARPFQATDMVALLIPPPASTYAFPSAHTSVAFAIAAALTYGSARLGVVAFLMAALVAFGRIGTGVHYPTDVLGGIVVGVGSFLFVRHMHRALRAQRAHKPMHHTS